MPAPADPLDALDPSARRAGPRARIAVGAAVVLFVAAVAVAALLSAAAGGGGAQGTIGGSSTLTGRGGDGGGDAGPDASNASVESPDVGAAPLLVHVLGAVVEPGIVELEAGARVVDAIAAAGGPTADADPAGVNLARPVVDGEQVVVPVVGAVPAPAAGGGGTGGGAAADGLVHLNTADLAALDTLPRIGPAMAQRILDWREANGPFTSVDQLREVAGIGDATFSGLAGLVAL
ncbi:helix-hairpin-helix domain-containing protein [Agromyces sp. MMS24-K17]|uniref:helix-hairpin-helix domain-containing protein n=1 Tax=Agromyces sp. MMS24-K17 TaxID=3372850 RepID=UPI003754CAC2